MITSRSGVIHEDIKVWHFGQAVWGIHANTNLSILLFLFTGDSFIGYWVAATGGIRNGLGCAAACDRWKERFEP